jgi:hypothetical protein
VISLRLSSLPRVIFRILFRSGTKGRCSPLRNSRNRCFRSAARIALAQLVLPIPASSAPHTSRSQFFLVSRRRRVRRICVSLTSCLNESGLGRPAIRKARIVRRISRIRSSFRTAPGRFRRSRRGDASSLRAKRRSPSLFPLACILPRRQER